MDPNALFAFLVGFVLGGLLVMVVVGLQMRSMHKITRRALKAARTAQMLTKTANMTTKAWKTMYHTANDELKLMDETLKTQS